MDRDQRLSGPGGRLHGQEVVTAEGLGTPDALHPVQREMANRGGSQCGYCTPGFVCAMAGEYYRPDRTPTGRTERVGRRRALDRRRGGRPRRQWSDRPHPPGHRARPRARSQRLRPARPQRQPVPLHRLPADPRRRVRPRRLPDSADPLRAAASSRPRRRSPPGSTASTALSSARSPWPRRWTCSPTTRRAARRRLHRLGGRAQPPARPGPAEHRLDRLPELRRPRGHRVRGSTSAPPSPCPRSSAGWPGGFRCWTRSSRSSRPG